MDWIPRGVASCRVSPSVLAERGVSNQGGSGKPISLRCWDRVRRLAVRYRRGAGGQGRGCPRHRVSLHRLQLPSEPPPAPPRLLRLWKPRGFWSEAEPRLPRFELASGSMISPGFVGWEAASRSSLVGWLLPSAALGFTGAKASSGWSTADMQRVPPPCLRTAEAPLAVQLFDQISPSVSLFWVRKETENS